MRSGYPDLIFVYRYMIIIVQLLQSNIKTFTKSVIDYLFY